MMIPELKVYRKSGNEKFENINKDISLLDFWSWSYSDLMGNTERGKLAEYIVASALGVENEINDSFSKYDLISKEGIKIEVKTSAYLQSWGQKEFSKIIFNIPETFGWNNKNNVYDSEKKRQADVYVLCVLKHKEQETVNPLNIDQWEFYVLPTKIINKECKNNKTLTLTKAIRIGAVKCNYSKIYDTIKENKM